MHEVELAAGVSIAYETFGEVGDPALLLVMGFGAQMIAWHEEFCAMLAGRGRYVIRYDNRDCGLSSRFDDHPVDVGQLIAAVSADRFNRYHPLFRLQFSAYVSSPFSSPLFLAGRVCGLMVAAGFRAEESRAYNVPFS